jgi:hypothetical protein
VTAAPERATALHIAILLVSPILLAAAGCGGEKGAASATPVKKGSPQAIDQEVAGRAVISAPSAPYAVSQVANPGTVSGTVSLKSPLQPLAPTAAGRDSALCGKTIPDSSLQQRGTGLGGVVVWLDGVRKGKALPIEKRLELESDHCLLTPRVQGAVIGSAVNIIGHDDFRQHLRFIAAGEPQPRAVVLLARDEQVVPTELPAKSPGMVIVRDDDRPWPRAYLAVFDHPYFAVTKPDGTFTIDGVPPGKYTLVAWHERTKRADQLVDVAANGAVKTNVVLEGRTVSGER